MGRRARRRDGRGASPATTDYVDAEGGVLTVRDRLSPGTLRELEALHRSPAATTEDIWQRRGEFLFERMVVRWTIAELPLEGQAELLGRYRMAGGDERGRLRETLETHLRTHHPEVPA